MSAPIIKVRRFPKPIIRSRRIAAPITTPVSPTLTLSSSTAQDNASIGSIIGLLSVTGGIGSYSFSLLSNPGGLFGISGANLVVAATLSAGSKPILVQADNGAGSVIIQPFTITVTTAPIQSDPVPIIF